ncbi:MAG: CHAD domain-containing protein, partial [Nitrososphaerota archaeon]
MRTPADRRTAAGHPADLLSDTGEPLGRRPAWRVGAKSLRKQLRQIRDSVAAVCEESGVEDIHQMRVATRRLRTMARVLEATPAFRRGRVSRLRRELQPLADRLGAVRDLDILLQHLSDYEGTAEQKDEADKTSSALRDTLVRRREKALDRLRQTLQHSQMQKLLRHPRRVAKRLATRNRRGRRLLVRHVAGSALWTRYEAILSYEDAVAHAATTRQLHAIRIACKQLRYALELFSVDDDPCGQALIQTLKQTQDYLGDLQDSVFAISLLTQMRHDAPRDPVRE